MAVTFCLSKRYALRYVHGMTTPTMTTSPEVQALFATLANRHLNIETLAERGRDALDFHDVGVAGLAKLMAAVFEAGVAAGKAAK